MSPAGSTGAVLQMTDLERIYTLTYIAGLHPELFRQARDAWKGDEAAVLEEARLAG